MYAVFFMSETLDIPGIEDQTIHVFDDKRSANEFIFEKLVEIRHIVLDGSGYVVDGERFDNQKEAVMAVQDTFGSIEFFHAYEAVEHRQVASA